MLLHVGLGKCKGDRWMDECKSWKKDTDVNDGDAWEETPPRGPSVHIIV